MSNPSSAMLVVTGRCLIGLYFLVPGLMKFLAWDMHLALMAHHGVAYAAPLLGFAGMVSILGALLLFANRFVRFTALGFALYILLVNALLHDFWNFEGVEGAHEMQNFIKNLGILAGLLVLAGISPMRWPSLSGLAKSDARVD